MTSLSPFTRRDPFGVLMPIDRVFSRFFENEPTALASGEGAEPLAIDVSDDGANFVVHASLPGFTKDQIDVEVNEDLVTIRGVREETKEESEKNFLRRERFTGTVTRTVRLPSAVDDEKAGAELKDGVLTLTLPRRVENGRRKLSIN